MMRRYTTLFCKLIMAPLAGVLLLSNTASADRLADQRRQYDQAMSALKAGQITRYQQLKPALTDYPLYPYLLLAELNRQAQPSTKQLEQFVLAHGDLPTAQGLKNKWLRQLARQGDWSTFRAHYDEASQDAGLDCQLTLQDWREGNAERAMQRATELWTVGRSQPKDCDPLFERWREAGGLTEEIAWQRIRLALLYRQDALATYLTRYVTSNQALADRFVQTATRPTLLKNHLQYRPSASQPGIKLADVVTVALRRLGRDDPAAAYDLWPLYRDLPFTESDRLAITRDIGVRLAKRHDPDALAFMAINDPTMADDQISEWRVRLALRTGQFDTARNLTQKLPATLSEQSRWRYWKLRSAQLASPDAGELTDEYAQLAEERDFYGFLAAEQSRRPYALNHQTAKVDPKVYAKVSETPAIRRAREFHARGQIVDARREWYHASRFFDRDELVAQATMASQMEWYFPAIRSVSQAQHWDDLDIRFPLAYQQPIVQQAAARQLKSPWVYAITRQESAFMADARSHAGAMGLMQLMPATAKETARRFGIPLSNPNDVLLPERNIALGAAYLSQLNTQFSGNRVLASAAYNAGPGRVRQWTRDVESLPADVWVEAIPFDETRQYVQSVLSYAVIYGEKLGIKQPVMENHERYLKAR